MTLEQALREAAAKGLTHFTIWPVPSEDRKTTYWYARATPSTQHSYVQAQGIDPVEVATQVLKALPKAKKVTAKVSDDKIYSASGIVDMGADLGMEPLDPKPTPEPQGIDAWLPKM